MIANTRLLAQQILKVVQNISMYMRINIALCIGGGHPSEAREYKKAHVLVGTPGRICEMISKNVFDPKRVKTLIMDESDVLLKDDFRAQIEDIVKGLGSKTQICVFSATFTKETLLLTENFLTNPYRVTIEKEAVSVKNIKQYKIAVGYDRIKLATLKDLFGRLTISQMIIFVRSIRTAEQLRNDLMDDGFDVGMVHGKMNSIEREQVLREFRLSNIRILISTDVMCRGIDIDDLRIVINYDMADDPDTYIHRVGRSGRYGGQGVALNFCTYDDNYKINMLRREYAIDIDDMPDPEIVNEYLTGMTAPTNKVSSANNYK
jgi:translation initiation factor 4A